MTKTKQQIQNEIAALQKQLEEMENLEMKDIFFWGLELGYSCNIPFNYINGLFMVRKTIKHSPSPSHGLGKFERKGDAERTRAVLIGALDLAKKDLLELGEITIWNDLLARGQAVIKAIEEGTYE